VLLLVAGVVRALQVRPAAVPAATVS